MKLIDFKSLGPSKGINYSRDHLRRKAKAGEFPKPVALSDRRIAWREEEVDEWLASRPRRDGGGPPAGTPERGTAARTALRSASGAVVDHGGHGGSSGGG
jgi:predicted DNA-binding transcriptional regulator AlpA